MTFVINAESCEETTLNQAFTRTALANNSCAIIPGLDHISLECTGTNGTATGYLWGILNTEVRASGCLILLGMCVTLGWTIYLTWAWMPTPPHKSRIRPTD